MKWYSTIRIRVFNRIIIRIMIQTQIGIVVHSSVRELCIISTRLRDILSHRRIRWQPPTVLRIQVPCSVVIQPGLFILLFRRKRRNLAVASRVLLCKTRRKSVRLPNMFFCSSNAMILSRCWIVKERSCKIFHGISCRKFLSNWFIIMHQGRIVKCYLWLL